MGGEAFILIIVHCSIILSETPSVTERHAYFASCVLNVLLIILYKVAGFINSKCRKHSKISQYIAKITNSRFHP